MNDLKQLALEAARAFLETDEIRSAHPTAREKLAVAMLQFAARTHRRVHEPEHHRQVRRGVGGAAMTDPQDNPAHDYCKCRACVEHHRETLRDRFAGLAMAGYNASREFAGSDPAKKAEWAYVDADALLAARERKP